MSDILWTSRDMETATGGTASAPVSASGVSIDTRTLKKGEVYLAIQGEKLDGHDYVDAAFKAGAAAAVVREGFPGQGPFLHVADTLKALEDLGVFARARAGAKIIGVTGSVGKTGTKEMLSIALAALGDTHASKKSFNNHWGVPLTLANLPPDVAFGVFEMGMNHAGEMRRLSHFVRPHIAIITTIEPAHIAHFTTVEAIADAKAEIFEGMDKDGIVILPADNPHFLRLRNHALKAGLSRIIGFGEDEGADSRLTDLTLHADSSRVSAVIMGQGVKYKLNIPGRHIVMNSLAALSAVKAAGGDLEKAVESLRNAEPVEGRGSRLAITLEDGAPPVTLIDESYNANPASMAAALSVLEMAVPAPGGRRVAVLGDMLELGPEGPKLHAALANPLLKARAELVFCCGPQMEALYTLLPEDWRGAHTKESRELAEAVVAALRPGDVVLVKGSLGSKMAYVVEALRNMDIKGKPQRNAV